MSETPDKGRAMGNDTTVDLTGIHCPACGTVTAGPFCHNCGYALERRSAEDDRWPQLGDRLDGRRALYLRAPLPCPIDGRRFLAEDEDGARYEVLVTEDPAALAERAAAAAALGEHGLAPAWTGQLGDLHHAAVPLPPGVAVADVLATLVAEREHNDAVALIEAHVLPIARCIAGLHRRGLVLGAIDPNELLVEPRGRSTFRWPPTAHPRAEVPIPPRRRRVYRGFSAPELHGRCGGAFGPPADVYFAGLVLYYALARIAPLAEAAHSAERLPAPHIYHRDVPPELGAVARRATSPIPARRYVDGEAFLHALETALHSHLARVATAYGPIAVDVGHELHIGVLKGQYAPQNQDDLFLAYHVDSAIGLFVVSDGVSISEYGSGDIASSCVRQEALNGWRVILDGHLAEDDLDDSVDANDETLAGLGEPEPALPAAFDGRARFLASMLDAANRRIGQLVQQEVPHFPGQPEGIMAATAVTALLQHNRVTLSSIGDSRIYLIRDGHIAQLTVDHDLATQLLRLGRAPAVARSFPAAGALIRCVGEFDKDAEHRLVAVPLQPEFTELTVVPGDTLLLCSDGIPDYAGFDEEDAEIKMREKVEGAPGAPWAAFELMVLANRGGGGDNISCIVLRFHEQTGRGHKA
ncbi:MAG: protein phosphatase 2C domain-containing protein [bacterium]